MICWLICPLLCVRHEASSVNEARGALHLVEVLVRKMPGEQSLIEVRCHQSGLPVALNDWRVNGYPSVLML